MTTEERELAIKAAVRTLADEHQADVYLFSGEIQFTSVETLLDSIPNSEDRNESCVLLLTTYGGDPNAGYRLARILQKSYEQFIVYVYGYCKSAGTLIALGANHIRMSDRGELGPLDVQVAKDDDLFSGSSVLDLWQSLYAVQAHAFNIFEEFLMGILTSSGGRITTRTASEVAEKAAVGLLSPIVAQIDPIRLGGFARLRKMSREYCTRLMRNRNVPSRDLPGIIDRFVESYPDHGFVIDCDEAKKYLKTVEETSETDRQVFEYLSAVLRIPHDPAIVKLIGSHEKATSEAPDADPFQEKQKESADVGPRTQEEAKANEPRIDDSSKTRSSRRSGNGRVVSKRK